MYRRRLVDVTRIYGCSTHNSPIHPANKVSSLHWRLQILPVHCLTLQYCYSLSRVHQGSKRVEADGSRRRHQYSPVYRRLANDNKFKTAIARDTPTWGASCREPGLDHKFLKSDFFSNSINRSYGYNSTSG